MNPFDRRTFLAKGVRTSAAVAVAGVLPGLENAASAASPPSVFTASSSPPGLVAQDLTVNGTADPIGVDPDACSFAWVLRSPARAPVSRATASPSIVPIRSTPHWSGTVARLHRPVKPSSPTADLR